MGRKVLATITALITAWGIIIAGKMVATAAGITEPTGLEYMTRGQIEHYLSTQPINYYVTLFVTSVIGAFFGGYIVTNMTRRESPGLAMTMTVCGFLIAGALVNFFVLLPGQPVWLALLTLLSIIPAAWAGHTYADAAMGVRMDGAAKPNH